MLFGGEGDNALDGGPGLDLVFQDPLPLALPGAGVALLDAESAAIMQALDDHERRRGRLLEP